MTPQLAPINDLQIDGADARTSLAGTGTTPLLSWNRAGAIAADAYLISIDRFERVGTQTQVTQIARIFARERALRVPAGILQSGRPYAITIGVRKGDTAWDGVHLFPPSFDVEEAESISAIHTP